MENTSKTLHGKAGGEDLEDVLLEDDVLDEGLGLDVGLGQHGGRGGESFLGVGVQDCRVVRVILECGRSVCYK